jgi:hypothetical protein
MTPEQREAALRLALLLEQAFGPRWVFVHEAVALLRELAAEPVQEPNPLAGTMAEAFLQEIARIWHKHPDYSTRQTLDALNAMFPVSEPEQEPVAWIHPLAMNRFGTVTFTRESDEQIPLYTHAQRQPEPAQGEPVAEVVDCSEVDIDGNPLALRELDWNTADLDRLPAGTKLYAAPQQRRPLTDEQLKQAMSDAGVRVFQPGLWDVLLDAGRAIERAHGITGEPT